MSKTISDYRDPRELIKYKFLDYRKIFIKISIGLCLAAVFCVALLGLNYGLEFTGGIEIELIAENQAVGTVRNAFADARIATVTHENHLLIVVPTTPNSTVDTAQNTLALLSQQFGSGLQVVRVDAVGPQVGAELSEQGGLGMLIAIIMILIYISIRFQYKFAIAAVVALFHDVLLSIFFASALQLTVDMSVIAVILALIGYSLNDTIVVSDRIRENSRKYAHLQVLDIFNLSFNQIIGRTVVTSFTTLLVVVALIVFGGPSLQSFSWLLCLGVIVGTYSSVYILPIVLIALDFTATDLIVKDIDEV